MQLLRDLIKHEQTTAVNIKSNVNRKSVQTALVATLSALNTIKSIPPNGVAIFAGINFDTTIISPPRPIVKTFYHCGKKFLYEPVEELFKQPEQQYGILQVFGEKTTILLSNEFAECKTIDIKTTKVQKKQCRGGQSKNRIERLREETIHNYLKLASEKAIKAFTKDGQPIIKALLLVGPGLKKEKMTSYLELKVPFYIYNVDSENSPLISEYLTHMIETENNVDDSKHIDKLTNLLTMSPGLLAFGDDIKTSLDDKNISRIYSSVKIDVDVPNIIINSSFLSAYGGMIGVKYRDLDVTDQLVVD